CITLNPARANTRQRYGETVHDLMVPPTSLPVSARSHRGCPSCPPPAHRWVLSVGVVSVPVSGPAVGLEHRLAPGAGHLVRRSQRKTFSGSHFELARRADSSLRAQRSIVHFAWLSAAPLESGCRACRPR